VKSVDTAPGLERLREPGFHKLSTLCCMRSTPTAMQSMNENDFECLAKTRVNTPPMAKMTDNELHGSNALDRLKSSKDTQIICTADGYEPYRRTHRQPLQSREDLPLVLSTVPSPLTIRRGLPNVLPLSFSHCVVRLGLVPESMIARIQPWLR
jgi:hypothetical protein